MIEHHKMYRILPCGNYRTNQGSDGILMAL